jgi:hypothetical protein
VVIEQHWDTSNLFISGEVSGDWAVEWNDTFPEEEVATLTYRWTSDDEMYLCLLNEDYLDLSGLYAVAKQLNMRQVELGPRLLRTFIETEDWRPTVALFMQLLDTAGIGSFGIELTGGRLEQA